MVAAQAALSGGLAWFLALTGVSFFFVLTLMVVAAGLTLYGIVRAFKASIVLGVVCLVFFPVLAPVSFVVGLVCAVSGKDLAEAFVNLFSGAPKP